MTRHLHLRLHRWLGLAPVALLYGCMSWTPGWQLATPPSHPSDGAFEVTVSALETSFRNAGSAEDLQRVRSQAYQLLELGSDHRHLLEVASHTEILYGAAYDTSRRAKAESYRRGLQLAERAMATDSEFATRVQAGAELSEAVSTLGVEHAEAMLLWVTGVSYYFKECLTGPGHIVNFRWMRRSSAVLDHLAGVAPDFENGAVPFSQGIYYLALPPSVGGDMELARDRLATAVSQSGSSLLPRWGRAKYFWTKTGDPEAFRSDLEWVLRQDPHELDSPYAWNVYFQRDAANLLDQAPDLF